MSRLSKRLSRGLSLVELMISLALSSVVTVGVIQLFTANSESYNLLQGQSRMQESARFAMTFIGDSVRSSRYNGCFSSPFDIESKVGSAAGPTVPPYSYNLLEGLDGYDATLGGTTWSPALTELPRSESGTDTNVYTYGAQPRDLENGNGIDTNLIVDGTDVITLRNMSREDIPVANGVIGNAPIQIGGTVASLGNTIQVDDVMMIHDCSQAMMFRVSSLTNAVLDLGGGATANVVSIGHFGETDVFANRFDWLSRLPSGFSPGDSSISHIESNTFFIAPGAGLNSSGDTPLSLWRKRGIEAPVELVEGVENMQILYGFNSDGDVNSTPDRYVTANEVTDWVNVVTVRVTLTVNSIDDVGATTAPTHGCTVQTCIDGEAFDGLLRRSFTQTFHIRN